MIDELFINLEDDQAGGLSNGFAVMCEIHSTYSTIAFYTFLESSTVYRLVWELTNLFQVREWQMRIYRPVFHCYFLNRV
jgi:hypothetical protein